MGKKGEFTFIDLFSGAGGFTLGFENGGYKNLLSIDIEPDFCATYKANFPSHRLLTKDISKITPEEFMAIKGLKNVDVVIGGPPCQGFSIAGNIGRNFLDDPRNHLFKEFARVVSILQPKIFVMENVARLYTHNGGATRKTIIETFEEIGYQTDCKIVCAADYGVPQVRNRVLFIGNRIGKKNLFPKKITDKYITVSEAIGSLPSISAGEKSSIANHEAMNHTREMLDKMSYVSDGGDRNEIPLDIRPKSGDVRKYIRYSSAKPSICVTGDMRKVFHYKDNRALTVRELARIQTFPDTFVFLGPKISQQQQVGNAVPPRLAENIALRLRKMLSNE
jgi:DNA (cytosine-5)-methyltransferase 1